MSQELPLPGVATPVTSTRRHPRFAVAGRIQCDLHPHEIPVPLLNVSRGGFSVRAPMKSRIGDLQKYRFRVKAEHDVILVFRARVVHCAEMVTNGLTAYLTGLEFIDSSTPHYQRAIEYLVGLVEH